MTQDAKNNEGLPVLSAVVVPMGDEAQQNGMETQQQQQPQSNPYQQQQMIQHQGQPPMVMNNFTPLPGSQAAAAAARKDGDGCCGSGEFCGMSLAIVLILICLCCCLLPFGIMALFWNAIMGLGDVISYNATQFDDDFFASLGGAGDNATLDTVGDVSSNLWD